MRTKNAAWLLPLLAAFLFFLAGCQSPDAADSRSASAPPTPTHRYEPSPERIVGYILDIDEARGFAVIDVAADVPADSLREGTPLAVRTRDLHPTAHLTSTRFLRGHTLGATIVTGLPAIGEEVTRREP